MKPPSLQGPIALSGDFISVSDLPGALQKLQGTTGGTALGFCSPDGAVASEWMETCLEAQGTIEPTEVPDSPEVSCSGPTASWLTRSAGRSSPSAPQAEQAAERAEMAADGDV